MSSEQTYVSPRAKTIIYEASRPCSDSARASPASADTLSVLSSVGPALCKTWRVDGSIESYGNAKYFSLSSERVANIHELHALLANVASEPRKCIIRGRPVPSLDTTQRILRRSQNFIDQSLHAVMFDIDSATTRTDPLNDPQGAITEWIVNKLPVEFWTASFSWQLSNSSGHPTKPGLRAHVWFWLDQPRTSAAMKAWVKSEKIATDASLFHPVQVHYTANPVFELGVADPGRTRSGFLQGDKDGVAIEIPAGPVERGAQDAPLTIAVKRQSEPLGTVRKAIYHYIKTKGKDISSYEDWIDIGQRLHDQTGGTQEGLNLWDEISATDKSKRDDGTPRYQGIDDLQRHWYSFNSSPGKRVVGMKHLIAQMPAEKDEFDQLAIEDSGARPIITVAGGELHNNAVQCEQILSGDIYVRERQLVRIGGARELAPERSGEVRRDEGQAAIIPATPEYLRRLLNQRVRFRTFRVREKKHVWIDCPKDFTLNIAGQGDWPALRPLIAIATAPFVRPDKSICETLGYDAASRVFYEPNAKFPTVPVNPTRENAERALNLLLEPFGEFPFASGAARSAFAAHVLTEIVRPAIGTSPAFFYTAPTPGTGKTLLSEMAPRIAHGCAPALRPWAEGGEELRKSLFSSLLAGDRTIGFDNLPNGLKVRSPALCGFLTADKYGDRKLGASEVPSVPNRSVVSLTGNNLTPTGDLARRSLVIRLDADTATLRDRRFRIADLRSYVREARPSLLVSSLTIIGAFNASGEAIGKTPLPSFEQWSHLVRDPLLWLGMVDPVATQDDETDDETASVGDAFQHIEDLMGEDEFTASDLAEKCATLLDGDPLSAAIEAAGCREATDSVRVGYWLRDMRGRIAGGLKMIQGGQARGAGKKWRLRKIGR